MIDSKVPSLHTSCCQQNTQHKADWQAGFTQDVNQLIAAITQTLHIHVGTSSHQTNKWCLKSRSEHSNTLILPHHSSSSTKCSIVHSARSIAILCEKSTSRLSKCNRKLKLCTGRKLQVVYFQWIRIIPKINKQLHYFWSHSLSKSSMVYGSGRAICSNHLSHLKPKSRTRNKQKSANMTKSFLLRLIQHMVHFVPSKSHLKFRALNFVKW